MRKKFKETKVHVLETRMVHSGSDGKPISFLHADFLRLPARSDGVRVTVWLKARTEPGGIGFTMSIFITNLAFTGDTDFVNASKWAILMVSLAAGVIGFVWLKLLGRPTAADMDTATIKMNVEGGGGRNRSNAL